MGVRKIAAGTGLGTIAAALLWSAPVMAVNVDLEVDASVSPPVLKVARNTARCPGGPIECIEVTRQWAGHMQFMLRNACQGVDYRLTEFRLRLLAKPDWPSSGDPMDAKYAQDLCVRADDGYVDWNACNNVRKDHMLLAKNNNREAMEYYYLITAEHCSTGQKIYLDPVMRNTGGGNQAN